MRFDLFNADPGELRGLWLCLLIAGAVVLAVITWLVIGLFRWIGWVDAHFS